MIPQKRQTAGQKWRGSAMDQAYSACESCTSLASPPSGLTASRMKRVTFACATCEESGVQIGFVTRKI